MEKRLLIHVQVFQSDEWEEGPDSAIVNISIDTAKKILGLRKKLKDIEKEFGTAFAIKAHDHQPYFYANFTVEDHGRVLDDLPGEYDGSDGSPLDWHTDADVSTLHIHHDYFFWECDFDNVGDDGLTVTTQGLEYEVLQALL